MTQPNRKRMAWTAAIAVGAVVVMTGLAFAAVLVIARHSHGTSMAPATLAPIFNLRGKHGSDALMGIVAVLFAATFVNANGNGR